MNKIGLIGTATFLQLENLDIVQREIKETPYGIPAAPLVHGLLQGKAVVLLSRNQDDGSVAPHKINYRANIWALKEAGVSSLIALSPVNGVRADMTPGTIVVPDQLIDYTYDRAHTFFEDDFNSLAHIDFRYPYSQELRENVLKSAHEENIALSDEATYGVIQGPRLTTLAETSRFERDGCHILGMTGMPETILARELNIAYTCIAIVTHKAAGKSLGISSSREGIGSTIKNSLKQVHRLVEQVIFNVV